MQQGQFRDPRRLDPDGADVVAFILLAVIVTIAALTVLAALAPALLGA